MGMVGGGIAPDRGVAGAVGGAGEKGGEDGPSLSVGELLLRRRIELDLTQDQIAERAGIAKSYVSQIENRVRKGPPSEEVVRRLERALELEPGVLVSAARWEATPASVKRLVQRMEGTNQVLLNTLRAAAGQKRLDEMHRTGELERLVAQVEGVGAESVSEVGGGARAERNGGRSGGGGGGAGELQVSRVLPVEVPLINSVAAGYPCEFTDLGYPARVAHEYVRSPDVRDRDAFAARVVGDSMTPEYREGDIVVFSPARQVASGMDCFVRLEPDHETTFKRVFFESRGTGPIGAGARVSGVGGGGELIRLQPLNPRYPSRVLAREQVAGLYAAVSVTRSLG